MSSRAKRPQGAESRDPPCGEGRYAAASHTSKPNRILGTIATMQPYFLRQPYGQTVHTMTEPKSYCVPGDNPNIKLCL